ncbi:hypothetical protein [uncultured Desulfovibrio sp.]|uniref:hypothetical protein n=1 Tax=uncultured Desulfovibrio sp. TaxID=167968 RepID=UPI00260541AB|nr:hypothetical protein [uncultured Desulfovibrio sp.]
MRTLLVSALSLVPALALCLSIAPVQADVALPPGLVQPYDKKAKPEVTCRRAGGTVTIYLHTPGPCDYTVALSEEGGGALVGPHTGRLERFGRQSVSVRFDIPARKPGETVRYRYTARGRLHNYKKVPITENEDEGRLAAMGRNLRVRAGLADPYEFRYELKDRNGKPFHFDVSLVVTGGEGGDCAVVFDGKPVR